MNDDIIELTLNIRKETTRVVRTEGTWIVNLYPLSPTVTLITFLLWSWDISPRVRYLFEIVSIFVMAKHYNMANNHKIIVVHLISKLNSDILEMSIPSTLEIIWIKKTYYQHDIYKILNSDGIVPSEYWLENISTKPNWKMTY